MASIFTGTLIFSHIIPVILGFLSIILLVMGMMDDEKQLTIVGIILFVLAVTLPFVTLNFMI